MFWDSVVAGLKVLTYWQTYAAGFEYLAIFVIPMVLASLFVNRGGGAAVGVGCLSAILLPLLQVAAVAIFTLSLSPIILDFETDAAWSFPGE